MGEGLRILFDTTVLIDALRSRADALELLDRAWTMGSVLYTSAVSIAEVYGGLRQGEEEKTNTLMSGFRCLNVTASVAQSAGELKVSRARLGRTYTITDMMIVATALEYDCLVATANRKDFPEDLVQVWPESELRQV